jgi:ATP-dependent helicase/nuclease subunit B
VRKGLAWQRAVWWVHIHGMRVRLWLGPAGSGKTHRCLSEIREALRRSAEGPPLLLVVPRQMTFQLERQLLSGSEVCGYTRLQVLSFERLCFWLWEACGWAPLRCLSAEGRVMVLRALLGRLRNELKVFRASARWTGFAQEVSEAWVECRRHGIRAERVARVAGAVSSERLAGKLSDFALLARQYEAWLEAHGLVDVQMVGEHVTERLARAAEAAWIGGVWVDGFAELAPQEIELLAALTRHCECMTVTFCLDAHGPGPAGWLSPWWVVERFKRQFQEAVGRVGGVECVEQWLPPRARAGRFVHPALFALERAWASGSVAGGDTGARLELVRPEGAVRLVVCESPREEATFVAREIWRFVRAGGRFREVLVLVRDLEEAQAHLRRVFAEYEIPYHLDQREPVAYHPLAVLTRSALRLVGQDWRQADWFAALKCGLLNAPEEEVLDALENQALAEGWEGRTIWLGEVAAGWFAGRGQSGQRWWRGFLEPWRRFDAALGEGKRRVEGRELVAAVRDLWEQLGVEDRLRQWAAEAGEEWGRRVWPGEPAGAVHGTVWEQMQAWLEDLELAFGAERLEWKEWLPVLEAGLAGLTVGVIPPALDQVLVGAVHRSRQSEARLVFLLGWNEGVFPCRPVRGPLLTEAEWAELAGQGLALRRPPQEQRAAEEHFAYLACTRAREQLVISWCRRDAAGRVLNPSAFCTRLKQCLPGLREESSGGDALVGSGAVQPGCGTGSGAGPEGLGDRVHLRELWPWLLRACQVAPARVRRLPEAAQAVVEPFLRYEAYAAQRLLRPEVARALYGERLRLSVSQLERFAACPFQFFVWGGLLARERPLFEAGAVERGSFQHELLARFHQRVSELGLLWRELDEARARALLWELAEQVGAEYRAGLFRSTERRWLLAQRLVKELEDFLAVSLDWMRRTYRLDPVGAEWRFGEGQEPGWRLEWPDGRVLEVVGRLDRVDVGRLEDGQQALVAVIDYKTGRVKLDPWLIRSGVDLQLRVYLNVVGGLEGLRRGLGVHQLRPVGAFYVPLRPRPEPVRSRAEAEGDSDRARAYQHQGLFDATRLAWLENAPGQMQGEQFVWRRNQDGSLRRGGFQALGGAEFERLLQETDRLVREMAERIWRGEVGPDPYQHRDQVACDRCECQWICRLDRHRHRFRKLTSGEGRI